MNPPNTISPQYSTSFISRINSRFHPEIYIKAQEIAGLKADEVISFEDAKAGVEAIKAAGQFAVGIGDKELLKEADYIVPTTAELKLSEIEKVFNEK